MEKTQIIYTFHTDKGTFTENGKQAISLPQQVGHRINTPTLQFIEKRYRFKYWCRDKELKCRFNCTKTPGNDANINLYAKCSNKYLIPGIIGALALLALIAILIFACMSGWFDPNARQGYYDGKTEQEIIDDLNRQVAEGEIAFSMKNTMKIDSETMSGEARIENIEANNKDIKVVIKLKDTGDTIYQSGAIAPGNYIQDITLSEKLEPGVYKAVAYVEGYKLETHEKMGTVGGEINILVE